MVCRGFAALHPCLKSATPSGFVVCEGFVFLRISAHICVKKTAVCVTTHIGRESFLSRKNAKRAKDTKIIFFEIISGNFFQKRGVVSRRNR